MYSKQEIYDMEHQKMVIYQVTNLINNKKYIGQTTNSFNQRYKGGKGIGAERILTSKRGNIPLTRSIEKYGHDNFKVEIVERCASINELNEREAYYIELYDLTTKEKGYNLKGGGENGYWGWKQILGIYIWNKDNLNREIKRIERLGRKINTDIKYIVNDMYREPIISINKNTGKIRYAPNILTFCFRNEDNSVKRGSWKKGYNPSYSPVKVLISCKQFRGDEKYRNIKNNKNSMIYEVFYAKDRSDIVEAYKEQQNILMKKHEENLKKKKNEQQKNGLHQCLKCGKKYKIVSKYCADCAREIYELKKMDKKIVKTCSVCNKEHTRSFETCSPKCTKRLKNSNKKNMS